MFRQVKSTAHLGPGRDHRAVRRRRWRAPSASWPRSRARSGHGRRGAGDGAPLYDGRSRRQLEKFYEEVPVKGNVLVAAARLYRQSRLQGARRSRRGSVCTTRSRTATNGRCAGGRGARRHGDVGRLAESSLATAVFVIHLAATPGRRIGAAPERYMHTTSPDRSADRGVAETRRRRVRLLSSCAVYALPKTDLLDETHPFKRSARTRSRRVSRSSSMPPPGRSPRRIIALFNAAGADKGGEIGEAHEPEAT